MVVDNEQQVALTSVDDVGQVSDTDIGCPSPSTQYVFVDLLTYASLSSCPPGAQFLLDPQLPDELFIQVTQLPSSQQGMIVGV